MKNIFTFFFLAFSLHLMAQGTYVYFQNNTHLSLTAATTATGGITSSEWEGYSGTINPWQAEHQIIRVDRNWASVGETFDLNTRITWGTATYFSCDIQIRTSGFGSSSLRQSLSGQGFSLPQYTDRVIHQQNMMVDGVLCKIRFQAYSTAPSGVWDDVLYAIDYVNAPSTYTIPSGDATNPLALNVLTYNVFFRPTTLFDDDQALRMSVLLDAIRGFDVVIFVEFFDDDLRRLFLIQSAAEYPYVSNVVNNPNNPIEDGGVFIASKFPIEYEDQLLWGNNCNQDDCLANKGVRYARVNKLGAKYHLFGTHMDAFNDPADVNMRQTQMTLFNNFVNSKNIPTNEAVLMGGDFNVERIRNQMGEYDSLATRLHCDEPQYGGYRAATWDPETNFYNARTNLPAEYLDFICPHLQYRRPYIKTNHPFIPRNSHNDFWRIFDLSDHYPVWGRFLYSPNVGVDEQEMATQIQVYPNPISSTQPLVVKGVFDMNNPVDITIVSMLGELAFSAQVSPSDETTLRLEGADLSNGAYIVRVSDAKGVKSAKLIYQN